MKRIEVVMTDQAYSQLRQTMMAKAMADTAHGVECALAVKLVQAVDAGETRVSYRIHGDRETPE